MLKSAFPAALILGAISFPWADDRSEAELSQAFEEQVVKPFRLELAQAYLSESTGEKRQREYQQYLQEERQSLRSEPQYIWTPDGRLQGWQQPDARGNIQQYDLKGNWKGTIYNED